ncbi:MAG: AAA family ATPase [Phycisphaera sp.]|nr:AAA family ATPase [Phycisphaera sp.]
MTTHSADQTSPAAPANKHFVLDTNVLLHNPECLFLFGDNRVVIPFTVIEELDKFKKNNDDTGRNARQVIRHLDALRRRGRLADGVPFNGNGGAVQIALDIPDLPPGLNSDNPDNRIIAVAFESMKNGNRTVFISKDINARIKSDALGIPTEDFEAQKVDADRLYRGYHEWQVDTAIIDQLYEDKQLPLSAIAEHLAGDERSGPVTLHANQYVLLHDALDDSHTGLARRLGDTEHLIPVTGPRKPVFGILPRNVQQTMALDLLLDDDVKLITLLGTAGTGKTLLALAAGMTKTLNEERYDRLLVARPIMPLGRDIGFLPGDISEKLAAWMQPIFDNLTYLLSTRGSAFMHAESKSPEQRIKSLLASGQVVLEPLTYIRGRSIPNQFMIVDEAQNLSPHEVKTIATRVGEGTKLILTGDVAQIDNPYLDSSSNGLSYVVESLKGNGIVGHITLAKSERSDLASLVALKL